MPLATAIRQLLIELETGKMTFEGQRTKTELIYKYLTGHQFRHRMEAIVEHFSEMHADLQRERKATLRLWAKREGQLRGVLEASAGLYGDVQGIAGLALPNIQSLEILAIDTDALPSD